MCRPRIIISCFAGVCLSAFTLRILAHKGKIHAPVEAPPLSEAPPNPKEGQIRSVHQAINDDYKNGIRDIFQKKCFNCHSSSTVFPWYYRLPFIKTLIDSDIEEAKEHLDFSKEFPFVSHATPVEDLLAIDDALLNGRMPPLRYRMLHWDSSVSEAEQSMVHEWVNRSLGLLRQLEEPLP